MHAIAGGSARLTGVYMDAALVPPCVPVYESVEYYRQTVEPELQVRRGTAWLVTHGSTSLRAGPHCADQRQRDPLPVAQVLAHSVGSGQPSLQLGGWSPCECLDHVLVHAGRYKGQSGRVRVEGRVQVGSDASRHALPSRLTVAAQL